MYLPDGTLLQGGKYRIIRHISSGGFGCTYEAEHTLLNVRVAIKEFFVKDFCDRDDETSRVTIGTRSKVELVEKLRRKFVDEARSIAQMNHPGIVRVSDIFEENGTAYYVMDFIDGCSLHEMVKYGFLPEKEAVRYIRQVAEALSYVHGQNKLHLDIKPGNIMVDKNTGRTVLIDFGASKQYDEASGENTSTVMGMTPGYAPIEQLSKKIQSFSPATDIYSLGATFYKLLSGTTPPDAPDIISGEEPLPPLPGRISEATRNVVAKSMAPKRQDRLQSIDEFLKLLDEPSTAPEHPQPDSTTGQKEQEKSQVLHEEETIIDGEYINDKAENVVSDETQTEKLAGAPWYVTVAIATIIIAVIMIGTYTSTNHHKSTSPVPENIENTNIQQGQLVVNSSPQEAQVFVDGLEVGITPCSYSLASGQHNVHVIKSGYQRVKKVVNIYNQQSSNINVTLELESASNVQKTETTVSKTTTSSTPSPSEKKTTPESSKRKETTVSGNNTSTQSTSDQKTTSTLSKASIHMTGLVPGTQIWMDGKEKGTVNSIYDIKNIEVGAHHFVLIHPDYVTFYHTVNLVSDITIDFAGKQVVKTENTKKRPGPNQVIGRVVCDGEPIIAASVYEVGRNKNGTVTDLNGYFTLQYFVKKSVKL